MKLSRFGNRKIYHQSDFKEGKRTCPVCKQTDTWDCNFTEDETFVYCKNTPNASGITDSKGKYLHILKNDRKSNFVSTKQATIRNADVAVKADADRLNEVYTAFLTALELEEIHFEKLVNERGLSEQNLPVKLYGSVPSYQQRFKVAGKLAESFDLEGIPGFFIEDGKWALHLTFEGFYVPFRDEQGRIVGLQIRKDKFDPIKKEKKYMWLSTRDKEKGSFYGAPLHFINPEITKETNEIFITEGALKADVIGELYNVGVMAMGGVDVLNADEFVASMLNAFPNLERVVIAFDMDWEVTDDVKRALSKMLEALKTKYLSVFVLTWDRNLGKGFDDVLFRVHSQELSSENLLKFVKAEEFEMTFLNAENEEPNNASINVKLESDDDSDDCAPENMGLSEKPITTENVDTFGITCRDFLAMDLPILERVIWGLGRGNLGLMVASTNIGKTTIALNLSLSAGMDKTFSPLFDENHKAQKVMYIDGEATKSELQADIRKMLESCSIEEQESIKDNLCFICDEEINDEPLDLVNPKHLQIVTEKAKQFKPDLIIVDTLSALTLMEDENDNAKVNKEVIQPLKALGRKANAGVLILHHTGKYSEGSPQAEAANQGRGASALPALSRVVYNLKKVLGSESQVTLSCSKDKVGKFESVVMELDQNTRWFGIVDGVSVKALTKSEQDYWKVVNYVKNENRQVERKEIVEKFTANKELSTSTVGRILEKAIKNGDLAKDYGSYFSPELKGNSESEKDNTQYCRVSRKDATKIYVNPNQELAVKK